MKTLINKIEKNYIYLLYLSIFSIFIASFKIYVVLFGLSIAFGLAIMINNKSRVRINKWQIALAVFISWSIVNSLIEIIFFHRMIDISMLIKININLIFLIVATMTITTLDLKINKEKLLILMEMIILANFLQIAYIYISGGLLGDLIGGTLTKNSDSAYVISTYNIIIGADNKNIWASKFLLIFIAYLYSLITVYSKKYKTRNIIYGILGTITIFLILSRTSQLALIVPLVFLVFYSIRGINRKYKVIIYSGCGIIVALGIAILINKFFHISFDMTDGGFTRLYIWNKFITNVFDTHFMLGNGLGYSRTFIAEVVQRQESNLHNVYMNLFFELGLAGILSYIAFLVFFVKENIKKNNVFKFIFIVIIPFLITTSLQYLGFDNDLVAMFILILIITRTTNRAEDRRDIKQVNIKKYVSRVSVFILILFSIMLVSKQESSVEIINSTATESNEHMLLRGELNKLHKDAYKATMDVLDSENLSDEEIQVKISEARAVIKEYKELYNQINDYIDNDIDSWGGLLDGEQQKILDKYHNMAYESTTNALNNKGLDNEEIQVKINEARQAIEKYKEFYIRASEDNHDESDSVSWGVLLDNEQQKILDDIEEKINNYIGLKTENNKQIALKAIPESMPDIWREELIQRINNI